MDGIINVLKPPGLTSRQVVSMIKGITKVKKVGHAGTLDPGAAGVLPVMIGKATRLFDYLGEGNKEYIGEFTFGIATTTQDSYGKVVDTCEANVQLEDIQSALVRFIGECVQQPSIYSAVHVNGKRAYDYAFAGQEVELPKRTVTIYEAEVLEQTGENSFLVRVLCSKGCYIRSLCEDVAKAMGTLGHLSLLLRTKTSKFDISTSYTLDELQEFKEDMVIPLEEILNDVPALKVAESLDFALHNGNKLPLDGFDSPVQDNVVYKILDSSGCLYALGSQDEDILRIKIMLKV